MKVILLTSFYLNSFYLNYPLLSLNRSSNRIIISLYVLIFLFKGKKLINGEDLFLLIYCLVVQR